MAGETFIPRMAEACTNMTHEFSSRNKSSLEQLLQTLRNDLVAADIKWSLFVCASQSYKQDSCLRPFPPMFLIDGNKDFLALKEAVECVPAFSQLEMELLSLPQVVVKLLCWLLVDLKEPTLTVVDKSEMNEVLQLVPCKLPSPCPAIVVRLEYDPSSIAEVRWASSRIKHGSNYAFHGSKLDNFHSILHTGLQQHLTKNALYGQGVYLSSELLVSLPYSRNGLGWSRSCVASELSVVALCELLDLPSVDCHASDIQNGLPHDRDERRRLTEPPHKVYVVPNNDLVRMRYLLVYTTQPSPTSYQRHLEQRSSLVVWIRRHKMAASLLVYAVMLTSIGLSRSPTMHRYWYQFCQYFGIHY